MEFISLINPSDIKVCGKLNFKIGKDKSDIEIPSKGIKSLLRYFECSKADTIVVGGPKIKKWSFFKMKGKKV